MPKKNTPKKLNIQSGKKRTFKFSRKEWVSNIVGWALYGVANAEDPNKKLEVHVTVPPQLDLDGNVVKPGFTIPFHEEVVAAGLSFIVFGPQPPGDYIIEVRSVGSSRVNNIDFQYSANTV